MKYIGAFASTYDQSTKTITPFHASSSFWTGRFDTNPRANRGDHGIQPPKTWRNPDRYSPEWDRNQDYIVHRFAQWVIQLQEESHRFLEPWKSKPRIVFLGQSEPIYLLTFTLNCVYDLAISFHALILPVYDYRFDTEWHKGVRQLKAQGIIGRRRGFMATSDIWDH